MDKMLLIPAAIFLAICVICIYGIYTDHIYKMKRLELLEKGIVKEIEK